MPGIVERELPFTGLGLTGSMPSAIGDAWRDCDRAHIDEGGALRAWNGWQRVGMKLAKETLSSVDLFGRGIAVDRYGYSRRGIEIVGFPEHYARKNQGHGLAAVDRLTGRPVGMGYQFQGHRGTELIGRPIPFPLSGSLTETQLQAMERRAPTITGSYKLTGTMIVRIKVVGINAYQYSVNDGSSYSASQAIVPQRPDELLSGASATGISVMFPTLAGVTINDAWRIVVGARPVPLGRLNRMGAHDYVSFAAGDGPNTGGQLLISTPWDRVMVDDGRRVRLAGIPAPHLKPQIQANIGTTSDADIASSDDSAVTWTRVDTDNVRFSANTSANGRTTTFTYSDGRYTVVPAHGSHYMFWGVKKDNLNPTTNPNYNILYTNSPGGAATVTIGASAKRIRMWIFLEARLGTINAGGFGLVFATADDLGGTTVVLKNDVPITPGAWQLVDFRVPTAMNGVAYSSMGFRKTGDWGASNKDEWFDVATDKIWQDDTDSDSLFTGEGNWYFRFTWYDSKTERQSAPSPYFGPIKLNSTSVKIDLSGGYPGIQAGLLNEPPPEADSAMVYVANDTWATDPRIDGLSFYRLSPDKGHPIEDLGSYSVTSDPVYTNVSGGAAANGTFGPISLKQNQQIETWTITFTSATAFTVTGSISGLQTATGTVGVVYESGGLIFQILDGTSPYAATDTWTFEIKRRSASVENLVAKKSDGTANTGTGTVVNLECLSFPRDSIIPVWEKWTLACTLGGGAGVATFSVTGSQSGLQATAASVGTAGTAGTPYTSNDGKIRFKIEAGGVNFTAGPPADGFTFESHPGALVAVFFNTLRLQDLIANPDNLISSPGRRRHPFFNSLPRPGEIVVVDGDVIVTAGRPSYSVGSWTWTKGSHVITPVDSGSGATTPEVGYWMEGRQIRRKGDDQAYEIIKVLDTNDDGTLDSLYIGNLFDAEKQTFTNAYQGESGTGPAVILEDFRNMNWTNVSEEFGVDVQAQSLLHQTPCVPAGDAVVGGGKIDEFLWMIGSKGAYVFRAAGTLADLPLATGQRYQNPMHLDGITILARRTFVSVSPTQAMWIGARGEVYMATQNMADKHPVSEALAGFLGGRGLLLDTTGLKHAWGEMVRTAESTYYLLHLIQGGTTNPTGVGVMANESDEYAFTLSGGGAATNPFTYGDDGAPYGASYGTDATLTRDFEICVRVDLKRNRVFLDSESRFSCGGVSPAHSHTTQGQIPGPNWGCDLDGFVCLMHDEKVLTWGNPKTRFVANVDATPGGATTIIVEDNEAGTAYSAASQILAADADGESMLANLIVAKLSTDGTVEYRRISSVSGYTITVSSAWTTNPVATDIVLIGPLPFMAHWAEKRGKYPMVLRELRMDVHEQESGGSDASTALFDPVTLLEVFSASAARTKAVHSAAVVSKITRLDDWEAGHGWKDVAAEHSKALSYRLTVLGGQTGRTWVRGLKVRERVVASETGR